MRLASKLAAVALLAWGAAAQCVEARPLDDVVASGTLRVIAYLDNAPFSFSDEEEGPAKGIDVDIAKAIARELGVTADVVLRMPGEKADDDLRANVWRGPLTGGGVGDLMMHVPIDREFALRNPEAVLGNAYLEERIVLAIHPELTGEVTSFDVFKSRKVGVQFGTVGDYFLMTYADGGLVANISHHVKPTEGAKQFLSRGVTALLGAQANIEYLLHAQGAQAPTLVRPPMPGIVRTSWLVGMAWREDSRDLGYAVEAALEKLRTSGELDKIFRAYGVTYTPPPPPPG